MRSLFDTRDDKQWLRFSTPWPLKAAGSRSLGCAILNRFWANPSHRVALRKDAKIHEWQHGNCKAPALARDEILRAIRHQGRGTARSKFPELVETG